MFSLFRPEEWRYERKFVIQELSRHQVESIVLLHPVMFRRIYHERQVNNIYFDTFAMTNYVHNVVGNSQRVKVRIRWYGNMFGYVKKPVLEIKLKSGALGSKISYPLESFKLDNILSLATIKEIFNNSLHIPATVRENLLSLDFSLLNSYNRGYFLSGDSNFRITIDSTLKYWSIVSRMNTFLEASQDHYSTILELKYARNHDNYAQMITNQFPFRLTKNSKYIVGVDRIIN